MIEQGATPTPERAMVVMAHPDDAEFICSGTVARWAAAGCELTYVVATSGDKGSDDPAMTSERLVALRESEQRDAARVLGVKHVEFLRYRDAELMPDLGLRLAITRMVRTYRPEAVICQDPTARWQGQGYVQHPDHLAVGEATLAAVFPAARDRLTFPELLAEGLEPHKTPHVFLMGAGQPDVWVDIGEFIDKKIEAMAAHRSQMGDWDFAPMILRWARDTAAEARLKGFPGADAIELAESFKYFRLA